MKVCVVGYGNMGRNHKRVLEQMGNEVQTIDPSVPAGADHSMLTAALIEWAEFVCVATPLEELSRIAGSWLERGRAVLVEKPGATDLAGLNALADTAERVGKRLRVGYTERFNPAVIALRSNLHHLGAIHHISARRLGYAKDRAGDPALDLATHDLDVLAHLGFHMEVQHVERSEHHVAALLRDGATSISIEASHLHPVKIRTLELVGDNGTMVVDYQRRCLTWHNDLPNVWEAGGSTEPLRMEWAAFFRNEGSDGTEALRLAEQLAAPVNALADAA